MLKSSWGYLSCPDNLFARILREQTFLSKVQKAALKELSDICCDYLDFSILCDLRHPLINYPYERSHNTCTMEERTIIEQEILKIVLEPAL